MEEDDARDRAALGARRLLFARLIAARDEATATEEISRLEDAVRRCGKRLNASTVACTELQRVNEQRRRALANACPAPPSLTRALLARRTLRQWCRRLRRDLRNQGKARRRLADASDALARAAHLATAMDNTASTTPTPTPTRKPARRQRARRILSKLSVDRIADIEEVNNDALLRCHWMTAANRVSDARSCSNFVGRTIEPDAPRRIAKGRNATQARNEMAWIEGRRASIEDFSKACTEELLALVAAVLELEQFIDHTREKICEAEGLLQPNSDLEVNTPTDVEALVRIKPRIDLDVDDHVDVQAFVPNHLVFNR